MQLTLYTKPADGFPPPSHLPTLSTIYTLPTDVLKADFLQTNNYLSEFKTEVDKARVRSNLGISDSYSFSWGNISGTIENQDDLMKLYTKNVTRITTLETSFDSISTKLDKLDSLDDSQIASVESELTEIKEKILDLKTNVALNSTDISKLSTGDTGSTSTAAWITSFTNLLGEINTKITNLQNSINTLNEAVSALLAKDTSITNSISNLETADTALSARVTTLETNGGTSYNDAELRGYITTLQLQVAVLLQLIGIDELTSISLSLSSLNVINGTSAQIISVTATYTKSGTKDITSDVICNSSNSTVASWDDDLNKVNINGVGSAVLTFSYNGKTATLDVLVSEASSATQIHYIGCAMTYQEVYADSGCKIEKDLLDGTYSSIKEVTESPYYLWIITKSVLNTFTEDNIWSYDVPGDNITLTSATLGGELYNIYQFHGDLIFGNDGTLNSAPTITITTK